MRKREIGICKNCNREMLITAKGLCTTCYLNSKIGICLSCGKNKPIASKGLCGVCYDRQLKKNNLLYKEKQILNSKKWRIKNDKYVKTKAKEKWEKEKDNPIKIKERKDKYFKKYGLSFDQVCKLKNEKCMLCGEHSETMHIDHDHESGKYRGVLCSKCNNGLGFFNDSIEMLKKAIEYLYKE